MIVYIPRVLCSYDTRKGSLAYESLDDARQAGMKQADSLRLELEQEGADQTWTAVEIDAVPVVRAKGPAADDRMGGQFSNQELADFNDPSRYW